MSYRPSEGVVYILISGENFLSSSDTDSRRVNSDLVNRSIQFLS